MTTDRHAHWQNVHAGRRPTEFSWYQEHPDRSMEIIRNIAPEPATPIIDVGGGSSSLVDLLLSAGYRDVTVLDIAEASLVHARERLGSRSDGVTWTVADVLEFRPGRRFGLWHDRAVFHFLTDPADQDAYRATLAAAVPPGGFVVVATFAADGPERCSGLPVQRYSSTLLAEALAPTCSPLGFEHEIHTTPAGAPQHFVYGQFRRISVDR